MSDHTRLVMVIFVPSWVSTRVTIRYPFVVDSFHIADFVKDWDLKIENLPSFSW